MEHRVMKTRDAAKYIGVSEWKLRELVHQHKIAYISDGEATSAFRFRVQALENYLATHEVPASE
jgi:excisionase family DNA binding protein